MGKFCSFQVFRTLLESESCKPLFVPNDASRKCVDASIAQGAQVAFGICSLGTFTAFYSLGLGFSTQCETAILFSTAAFASQAFFANMNASSWARTIHYAVDANRSRWIRSRILLGVCSGKRNNLYCCVLLINLVNLVKSSSEMMPRLNAMRAALGWLWFLSLCVGTVFLSVTFYSSDAGFIWRSAFTVAYVSSSAFLVVTDSYVTAAAAAAA